MASLVLRDLPLTATILQPANRGLFFYRFLIIVLYDVVDNNKSLCYKLNNITFVCVYIVAQTEDVVKYKIFFEENFNMYWFERIKDLRIKNNMTQRDLGRRVEVSTMTVGNWENGNKKPSAEALARLADVFNVSMDYIVGRKEHDLTAEELKLVTDYKNLDNHGKQVVLSLVEIEKQRVEEEKLVAEIAAGNKVIKFIPRYQYASAAGAAAPIGDESFEVETVCNPVYAKADFSVRIQGDSMAPYIRNGDIVYVIQTQDISVGDVGIFAVDGSTYCKQYYKDGNGDVTLVSANEELKDTNVYIPAESNISFCCLGKVILENRIKFPEYFAG